MISDAVTFVCFMSLLAIELVAWLRSDNIPLGVSILARHPIQGASVLVLVTWWVIVISRWLGWIRWPRWWSVPYVLLFLCPCSLVLTDRVRMGLNILFLILFQLPVMFVYIRRAKARMKE